MPTKVKGKTGGGGGAGGAFTGGGGGGGGGGCQLRLAKASPCESGPLRARAASETVGSDEASSVLAAADAAGVSACDVLAGAKASSGDVCVEGRAAGCT